MLSSTAAPLPLPLPNEATALAADISFLAAELYQNSPRFNLKVGLGLLAAGGTAAGIGLLAARKADESK